MNETYSQEQYEELANRITALEKFQDETIKRVNKVSKIVLSNPVNMMMSSIVNSPVGNSEDKGFFSSGKKNDGGDK